MIGTKFTKPVDNVAYAEAASWCSTNKAHIEDKGEYFEVVENTYSMTTEEKIAALEAAVQSFMDQKVHDERGYDSVYSCITYLSSPTTRYATEARAVLEWRDSIWVLCNTLLAQYKARAIEELTADEVIAKLPELVWNTEAI